MATASTAPAPKPAPAPASSASKPAEEAVPPAKFDIGRPFRYASGFIGGTVQHTLDSTALGGRKGAWIGTGLGLLALMAGAPAAVPLGLGALALGWAGGLVVGAVAGGAFGLVTGGARGLGREVRKTKYADDLLVRAKGKSQPGPEADYRLAHREYHQQAKPFADAYAYDRVIQQQNEVQQETNRFFRDHVEHSRMGPPHEHGF